MADARSDSGVAGNAWSLSRGWFAALALQLGMQLALLAVATPASAITNIAFDPTMVAFTGEAFSSTFTAVGGHQPRYPVFWTVNPSGCLLGSGFDVDANTGVLSGISDTPATYRCRITGFDSFDETSVTRRFSLSVFVRTGRPTCVPASIHSDPLPAANVGVPYMFVVVGAGNPKPTLAVSGLPAGLLFDAGSGVISGTPTTAGATSVTVTAANSCGAGVEQTQVLTVNAPVTALVISVMPEPAIFGQPTVVVVTASGGATVPQGSVQLCSRASTGYCGAPFDVIPPNTPADQIRIPQTVALDAAGRAQFSLTGLLVGDYVLTANYAGDSGHMEATAGPVDEFVIKGVVLPAPTVALSAPQVVASQTTLSLGVTVSPMTTTGGGPTSTSPTGVVQIVADSSVLAALALDATGHAQFNLQAPISGVLTLHAAYLGDASFASAVSNAATVRIDGSRSSSGSSRPGFGPTAGPDDPHAIPALSAVGTSILALLLAAVGALVARRRARHA